MLAAVNTALSAATLLYVVNTEHRITALEEKVKIAVELHKQEAEARNSERPRRSAGG